MNIAHVPSAYGGCLVKPPPPPPTAKCAVGACGTVAQHVAQCSAIHIAPQPGSSLETSLCGHLSPAQGFVKPGT